MHGRVMGVSQRVHYLAPDARPPPANEAIVARGVRTKNVRQVPPRRPGSQHPKDAVEDTAIVYPWYAARFVRQKGLDDGPFIIGEFIAHDSRLQFGSLNHVPGNAINPQRPFPADANTLIFTSAFRGIADMAGPAAGFVPVENDPGCVKTLRGITVPGILGPVVMRRAKKHKNLSSARHDDQIGFRFRTAKTHRSRPLVSCSRPCDLRPPIFAVV